MRDVYIITWDRKRKIECTAHDKMWPWGKMLLRAQIKRIDDFLLSPSNKKLFVHDWFGWNVYNEMQLIEWFVHYIPI
jgi:hypothetical protein